MLTIDLDRWKHLDWEVRDRFDAWLRSEGLHDLHCVQLWLADEGVVKLRILRPDWPLLLIPGAHQDAVRLFTTVHRCVSSLPPFEAMEPAINP